MTIHQIKIGEMFYTDVRIGQKTFEIRKNDRHYKAGDFVNFIVVDRNGTQKESPYLFQITYVLEEYAGLEKGYCIFSIEPYCSLSQRANPLWNITNTKK